MDLNLDVHSDTWKSVRRELEVRLDTCLAHIQRHQSEVETAALRGRIQEIKSLLALPENLAADYSKLDSRLVPNQPLI